MIVHRARAHNAPGRGAAARTVLVGLLVLAGCGGGQESETPAAGGAGSGGGQPCPVDIDASGWRAFADLAGRLDAGEAVDHAELQGLAERPAFALWRESLVPNVLSPVRLANWLEEAFGSAETTGGRTKANADRREFALSYRWSWEHRTEVDSLLALYESEDRACGIREIAADWVPAAALPERISVYFLPTKPEIRWYEGRVFVDTGVLVAGAPAQLNRQVAGLIYRNLGAARGTNPLEATGADAVAQSLRVLRNEGVAAWIEDLPHTYFRPDHDRLRRVAPIPERFYEATLNTVALLNTLLPPLFADHARFEAEGNEVARRIAAGGNFGEAGYGMAAVIAGRLGEDRLREAARTVPAFLAAFQEAARLNGEARPAVGAAGHEPYESVAPFTAETYAGLEQLVKGAFAPGS